MRCRRCKQRFRLYQTIHCSYPPGIPISPGGSLSVLLPILVVALLIAAAEPSWRLASLLVVGATLLVYVWHYVFNWFFEKNPYDQTRAGTCPKCRAYNTPMPWSL